MVNIHISQESKGNFKSKNAITRLKKFLKETPDVDLVSAVEYLKEGFHFDFKVEDENIHVGTKIAEHIWGDIQQEQNSMKPQQELNSKEKLRRRLKELQAIRTGKVMREMREVKKTVDKQLFQRYAWLKQNLSGFPLPSPTEILDNPEKHKDEIELFSSGFMKLSGNTKIDSTIAEYFKMIGEKLGYQPLTMEQIQQKMNANKPQQAPQAPPENFDLPSNINLSNYVDSDTESESSDDEKEGKVKEENVQEEKESTGSDVDV